MAANLQVIRYYFAQHREGFTLPEDTYEGWIILAAQSGQFRFCLAEDEQPFAEGTAEFGELVLCPPGCLFKRQALEPLTFHFAEFMTSSRGWTPGKVRIRDAARLSSTYHYLQEWQEKASEDKLTDEAQHLIGDLLFMVDREQAASSHKKRVIADPMMDQAAAYMEQRACEGELSLQELAAKLGISASQLTRRFQAAYGISPVHYVIKVRLSKAQLLLAETNDTLDAVSESCGFQNAFYFSRVFTKHMQISPSAFRRTFRV
ncbi:MAG: hypothetical protein K0S39_4002 [Paenibacillus sp.]|jgi:AraC-like DNA-binding protein|nr:hypothetical protein [Paenibacillus sp.]